MLCTHSHGITEASFVLASLWLGRIHSRPVPKNLKAGNSRPQGKLPTRLNRTTNVSVYLSFLRCRFQFINHDFAFSVVKTKGLDFHTNSHELGHNFGAGHNIEDALDPTGSAHGKRHCGRKG